MTLLPACRDRDEYRALHPQEAPWLEAVRAIRERHALPAGALERRLDGGNIVYLAGPHHVIKLFAPIWADEHAAERAVLERVGGRLPVATPEVTASGELEGWPYLVLTRVRGEPAAKAWADLPRDDQRRLAADLGRVAARLHELPVDGLEALATPWASFVAAREAAFVDDHARRGAPEHLTAGLRELVARADVRSAGRIVILHADLADVNVLLSRSGGSWSLSGVIDFGDAFVGAAHYELVTPGEFMFCGRPELVRAFLHAYGYGDAELDGALGARLMALTLLHRFGNVGRLAQRVGARCGIAAADLSLERLAELAWGFGDATRADQCP